MDPIVASIVAGGIISNVGNIIEARKNRKFQERMSNTAHSRQVADLRNAGLNPMLSANSGASTPGGGQASIENPVPEAVAASTARQQAAANIAQSAAQADQATANAAATRASIPGIKAESKMKEQLGKKASQGMGAVSTAVEAAKELDVPTLPPSSGFKHTQPIPRNPNKKGQTFQERWDMLRKLDSIKEK